MAETYMIDRVIAQVRRNADEPSLNAKYEDDDLIEEIESAFYEVMVELNNTMDNPVRVRHPISISSGTQVYLLPPSVGRVQRLVELNDLNSVTGWWSPGSPKSLCGPGFVFEGRTLRFTPNYTGSDKTLSLEYVPTGEFRLHYATAQAVPSTTRITFPASLTKGSLDTRENAYVGGVARVVSSTEGYTQERVITAYDHTTRIATVSPAFDPQPTGTVTYEVIPIWLRPVERVIALHVATSLMAIAGDPKRHTLLERQYVRGMRSVRMHLSQVQNIIGDYFEFDTRTAQVRGES